MSKCPEIELGHGPFTEPIGWRQRGQRPERAYARAAIKRERQQQQFELGFAPFSCTAKTACDTANVLAKNRRKDFLERLAARLSPQAIEKLALDFARK